MRVQCSTCLELLTPGDDLTCTPCGHVFHLHCVIQWFENKKNCPQCRHVANEKTLRKIYLAETDGEQVNSDDLQNQLESVQLQLRCMKGEQQKLVDKNQQLDRQNKQLKEEVKNSETSRRKAKELSDGYKSQIKYLHEERERNEAYRLEAERYRKQLDQFKAIQLVLTGAEGEVNRMLHERGAFDSKSRDLAVLIVEMKKKILDLKRERGLYDQRAQESGRLCEELRRQLKTAQQEVLDSRQARVVLEQDLAVALAENRDLVARQQEMANRLPRCGGSSSSDSFSETASSPLRHSLADDSIINGSESYGISSNQSSQGDKNLPSGPLKSCGIILCEKRRPLTEVNQAERVKRPRLAGNLYENFKRIEKLDEKCYDGLGGRAKNDEFPRPLSSSARPFAIPNLSKKKSTSQLLTQSRKNQAFTIDKYFGNFDTP